MATVVGRPFSAFLTRLILESYRQVNPVEKVFAANRGYASTTELLRAGADSRLLQKMMLDSQIVKIKRGLYKSLAYAPGSAEDMLDLAAAVPDGVFCLFTALAYHDLTTYNPPEF
jgi:hypothetical protein